MLAAACGTSALPADLSPKPQSISQAHIRLFAVYSLTAFIRLDAGVGRRVNYGKVINNHGVTLVSARFVVRRLAGLFSTFAAFLILEFCYGWDDLLCKGFERRDLVNIRHIEYCMGDAHC